MRLLNPGGIPFERVGVARLKIGYGLNPGVSVVRIV